MTKFRILETHCNEMHFRLNLIKSEPNTRFEINPTFNRTVKKIKELPKRRIVELNVRIEGTEKEPKPFDIVIGMSATIDLEEEIWLVEDEKKFVIDATRMLFPYLRSAVTSLTATAMINPLVLPPLDGGSIFPEDKQES